MMEKTIDLTKEQAVVEYMRAATSEADWNNRCDEVKRQNNGYLAFWFKAIMLGGVIADALWRRK